MGHLTRRLLLAATMVTSGACGVEAPRTQEVVAASTEAGVDHHFDVERIVAGLDRPTYVGAAPGDAGGLWVLEQAGRVVRIEGDRRTVVLDLAEQVGLGGEAGLLGMAFHPGFAANRRLFLHWNDRGGDTRVAEFTAEGEGHMVVPVAVRELLHLEQPEENHNGGQLAFGPDGRLYLGLGDGGGAFDPRQAAQDPGSPLGKVLATDVDRPAGGWTPVLIGLRNPWRFSFDRALSEIWVSDVGQDHVEEINRVQLELDEPPKNLGWSAYEGTVRLEGHELETSGELVHPVASYSHDQGCAVIGGVVYVGVQLEGLSRRYVFGDFCSGTLWSVQGLPGGAASVMRPERAQVPQLTHIGEDSDGELVFASATGAIFRAVPPVASR